MGRSVEEYLATCHEWWEAVLRTEQCPRCHRAYHRHQTRDRAAWEDCEHAHQRILVLRIRCPVCGVTRTVLPDFLTPYRRYLTPVREAMVASEEAAPPCDERTARRWRGAFDTAVKTAIHHVTNRILTSQGLSRQEQAFLRGTIRGYGGLRQVRAIAERHRQGPPAASCLLGWFTQMLYPQLTVAV